MRRFCLFPTLNFQNQLVREAYYGQYGGESLFNTAFIRAICQDHPHLLITNLKAIMLVHFRHLVFIHGIDAPQYIIFVHIQKCILFQIALSPQEYSGKYDCHHDHEDQDKIGNSEFPIPGFTFQTSLGKALCNTQLSPYLLYRSAD